MPITILGTIALDSIKTPKGSFDNILGGTATYAGIAASIFSPAHLVSVIGQDFPKEHITFLNNRGLNTQGVEIKAGETFKWKGYYEGDMSQAHTISTDLNVLLEFNPVIPQDAKSSRIVFLGNTDPVLQKQAIAQFNNPELIILDSMNFWIENHLSNLKETLKLIDVLILNDQEIRLLTKHSNLIEGIAATLEMGPKRIIVKKGEHGAIMATRDSFFACPALPLKGLVDPTGAGDSFAGGISGYLANAKDLSEATFRNALIVGTIIAYNTVQDFSLGKLKTLTKSELENQFKSYIQLTQFSNTL